MEKIIGFCPVYGADVTQYDCDEIRCGADLGWIPNDGIPQLMRVEDILKKKDLCVNCALRKKQSNSQAT